MKILFISRAFPPVIGGIENQNYELSLWLKKGSRIKTIANRLGKKFLPIFLPYALIKSLFLLRKYDVVLLGDAVLCPLGWILKLFYSKPVISIVHGLDLTYPLKIYQNFWIRFSVKKMDKLIAVGHETIKAGVRRGIPRDKFVFIPNGVDTQKFLEWHKRQELEKLVGEDLKGKKILLTTGRLVPHKGVAWFCQRVVSRLPDNVLYLVAGDGERRKFIEKIIRVKKLEKKVKLLGNVSFQELKILYNTADIYIKPNIKVAGTMEGFGIVVIEAASCRLPVIASKMEGLKDAIREGKNGFFVEPCNAEAYIEKINDLMSRDDFRLEFGEKARRFVEEHFSWEKISKQYLEEIKSVISNFKS
ncbi:glycosyltransferase family 4 protein [Patescibacteria group bacterium]|nr:glycosyltransferase family 4 protein [Patescibacteria group bacterium]